MKVLVCPYDPMWKSAFEEIKAEIEAATGDDILGIEHVGSTSVEGMWAKPCIDIDIVIEDYSKFNIVKSKLEEIGYIHQGDLGIKGREAFDYSDKPHLMKHHLYLCPKDSAELKRHIAFRDFLKANPKAAALYSEIKREGAKLFPNDIDRYIGHKSPIIEKIYKECGL